MLKEAAQKISCGQMLLIGCCVVYLVWWSLSFRPGPLVTEGISMAVLEILSFPGLRAF